MEGPFIWILFIVISVLFDKLMKAGRKRAEQQQPPPDWEDWEAGQPYEERSYSVVLGEDGRILMEERGSPNPHTDSHLDTDPHLEPVYHQSADPLPAPADNRMVFTGPVAGEIGAPELRRRTRAGKFMRLKRGDVRHGIILAEILGPPRSQTL